MKRGLKIVVSWLCLFSLLISPLTASGAGTTSGDPVWPNPGAIQLSKTAEPTGKSGEWKITLKAEGKNIKSSSDVVLVIDKSGSMDDRDWWWETDYKLADARTAAKKFVDNLLLNGSSTRIAVVSFNKSATNVSDFKGPSQKDALKTSIDNISASGGTNIQAGLKNARDLLANSSAQNKVIVVLSDGEPTYSFKGTQAKSSSWQNNSYSFAITKFDYGTTLGTGGDYDLSKSSRYEINNFSVKDNGIGTISEAKLAKDAGLKIFSVGLDVSKNSNAIKVLKDVQNEGYFSANSDELNTIFREMAGKISYAAQGAKVIDPMGDMFNLKLQGAQISPADYTVSQGTVTWDAATEKFNWNVGNIAEGEPATFTYTVVMDQSKNPVSNTLYPTNGKTTMEYTDVNNQKVSKDFEVPKVSIGNGSILMKGYKVNANGKPINAEGVEVETPEFAEALYSEYYKDQNGKEAFPMGSTHSVPAKTVAGYQLKVGESPRNVTLTVTNPSPVIWFGYTAAVEQTVTVKYLEKDSGKQLKDPTFQKGFSGSKVELKALLVDGYSVVAPDKLEYTFTSEPNQVHTFFYTANEQNVTVKYLKKGTTDEVAPSTTVKGLTGQTIELTAANAPGYTPEKATDSYTIKAEGNNEYIFFYTANEQNVTVKYLKKGTTDEVAPSTIVKGLTGQTIELTAANAPGYTPEKATDSYTIKAEGNNEYIFYYTASEQNVTVKYLKKGTTDEVAPSTIVKGLTGQTIELTAANAPGYTPEKATDSYTIKAEGNNEYIFYYTASEQNVTVKYLKKGTTDEVAPSTTVKGLTGQTIELTAANAPGYTPEKATDNYTIKAEGTNEYIFYYTASEQNVEVKYLEQGTNKVLAEPTTANGVTGQTIELKAKDIAGYTAVEPTHSYKLDVENAAHVFYYTANTQSVSVKYVDRETGKEIAEATSVNGVTGDTVTLEAKDVAGYTPEKATDSYTLKAEGNEYTFYYTANAQSVEVQYLEQGTNKVLAEPTTANGVTGQTIELKAKDIAGYTAVEPTHSYKLDVENAAHVFYYTANAQSVSVKYVDRETGKEIAEATSVDGVTGETVTLEAKDVAGYTPEKATDSYTLKAEGNEYTFYYNGENRTVEVYYLLDGTDEELVPPDTVEGVTGKKVNLEPKVIPGYTPITQGYSYTFEVENLPQYFYYTADEQSVEVQYLEQGTDKELADPTTSNGVTGQTIELKAKDIAGYTPLEPTYSYTLDVENAPHVFYYKANEPDNNRTLTVRYVDFITGNDLLDPTEHSGKVGEEITLTANDYTDSVTGAVYKPHDYSVPYTFKNEPLHDVFTFTYTQDVSSLERTVLVHHVDRESNLPLMEPTPASGKVGETIILKAGPISVADAVYMPEEFSYNYSVTLDLEQQFTIYYNLGEPSGDVVKLTISYLDRETNGEIASQEVIEGKAGTQFTLNAKNVPGYTPEIPSFEYRYSDEPNQNYVFYYTKNAPTDQQLTVKYLLNGTNEQLASPSVFTGKPGETKTLTAVSISGYTPVKSTDAYTFTTQAGQEYIFYYTRNSSNPGGSGGSNTSSGSTVTPLPALPPLPAVPPTLEMENHYDYINGYPDGSVKPLNNITREEVAAIFYRLLDDESRSEYLKTGNSFSDVGATRWSNKHISTMENAGVITGYPDGTFKPGQYITRAEFAAIASRFDKLDERANDSFTDITGHWAEKYIASAANKGWIKGYTDGTFKPNQYITRAEAAAFINSVLNRKVDKDGIHEDAKMWPDNVYGKWYYYDILEATNHHDYSREEDAEVEVWEEVLPNRVYP